MSPTPSELQATRAFAEKVVMPQGAIFIRELLRQKRQDHLDVHIGVKKDKVRENLLAAITSGAVRMSDLEEFVAGVEGWGNQHVYLYDASRVASHSLWRSPHQVRAALDTIGHGDAWESAADPSFPDDLVIGSASFHDRRFELLWRQKDDHWWRDENEDKPTQTIHGDLYEFRAYRQELKRSVMRFVLFPDLRKAALFLQIPLGRRHTLARETAAAVLGGLFPFTDLVAADVSTAIKVLDTRDLAAAVAGKHGDMEAQNTKFAAEGATVEFDADSSIEAWKQVEAVRRVRQALKTEAFRGQSGKFRVSLRLGRELNRDVVMSLNGRDDRIYVQAQLNAGEVWTILDHVLGASRPQTTAA